MNIGASTWETVHSIGVLVIDATSFDDVDGENKKSGSVLLSCLSKYFVFDQIENPSVRGSDDCSRGANLVIDFIRPCLRETQIISNPVRLKIIEGA